ncbi:hypothetical protein BDV10DRAFT_171504, partial [Aspergillus recurvatus]
MGWYADMYSERALCPSIAAAGRPHWQSHGSRWFGGMNVLLCFCHFFYFFFF